MRRFADAAQEHQRARLRSRWGPLAGVAGWISGPDLEVRNAMKGAAAEERVAAMLDALAQRSRGQVAVLHDRAIPGRRENLDHVVVAPSGIWAVDSKAYAGRLRVAGSGLWVGQRDCRRLVEQVRRQQQFLRTGVQALGLPDLPVHGLLCFVGTEIPWSAQGRTVDGVVVAGVRRTRRVLDAAGPLNAEQVQYTAQLLGRRFVPS